MQAEIARAMREPPMEGPSARVRWGGAGSKRPHPALLAAAVILLLLAAVFGATHLMGTVAERSPSGRVRAALISWEFGGASREAAFVELDQMGGAALAPTVDLMSDASVAERGSSRSTYTIRQIAQVYLLRVATRQKVPPPAAADEIVRALQSGTQPSDAQWASAQAAWRAWIAEQQARGALPK
ncbi:MAG: hypothetical protein HYV09_31650 [Deltaproteobacteria bacterium]|nr:hypothetical protein [Deltaproteobacteria bacterium]